MAAKTFEESMLELEKVVSKLESGDITLDESLKLFEKGIKILTASDDGSMEEKDFEVQE